MKLKTKYLVVMENIGVTATIYDRDLYACVINQTVPDKFPRVYADFILLDSITSEERRKISEAINSHEVLSQGKYGDMELKRDDTNYVVLCDDHDNILDPERLNRFMEEQKKHWEFSIPWEDGEEDAG